MERIYLDHGATTPMHPLVIEQMTDLMRTVYGNPSSIHQFGRQAEGKLAEARNIVAASIGAKEHEIIFTSGGTESDNTALISTALARKDQGNQLITTQVEHPAVLKTMAYLETIGFEVTYLPVDKMGQLSLDELEKALTDQTILVSIMALNNETGVRFPIKEIGQLLSDHPTYFHVDGVQAYGLDEIDVNELGIDLLSATAHKINGPKGIGLLYCRDGLIFNELIHGGEQEEKRRAGTENLPAIWGLATAISLLSATEKQARITQYTEFADYIITQLNATKIDFKINGEGADKSSHILNLRFYGVSNDLLLMHLDLQGIALSIGSACTAGNVEPSHVLESMYGKDSLAMKESVRISFGLGNTQAEIEYLTEKLIETVNRLKKH